MICRSGEYKCLFINDIINLNNEKDNYISYDGRKPLFIGHIIKFYYTSLSWTVWNFAGFCFYLYVIIRFDGIFFVWHEPCFFIYFYYCYVKEAFFAINFPEGLSVFFGGSYNSSDVDCAKVSRLG